jgi:hypothetical protein
MSVGRGSSIFVVLATCFATRPAVAQPLATEDRVIRTRIGVQTVPSRDPATDRVVLQQRTFADFLYRIGGGVDLGVALPTLTLDPHVGAANPMILGFYHFVHQPHWIALRFDLEPPMLVDSGWQLRLFVPVNLRLGKVVEFYNLPSVRLRLDEGRADIYTWQNATIFQVGSTLGLGPSTIARFTNDGFDSLMVGARVRWEWRDAVRTRGVLFFDLATSSPRPSAQSITVLAFYLFYVRL